MIQRVQSIYLVLCILCLASLLFGVNIIHFEGPEYHYSINALTIETFEKSSAKVISSSYHYGLAILLVLLLSALVTLLHFKNIKKQFKLGRTLFFTYFLCLVGAVIWYPLEMGGSMKTFIKVNLASDSFYLSSASPLPF